MEFHSYCWLWVCTSETPSGIFSDIKMWIPLCMRDVATFLSIGTVYFKIFSLLFVHIQNESWMLESEQPVIKLFIFMHGICTICPEWTSLYMEEVIVVAHTFLLVKNKTLLSHLPVRHWYWWEGLKWGHVQIWLHVPIECTPELLEKV